MARTPYKWFNINRIGPGKRVNGKSGKAETTIFWPHYSGKCRTVGTYSPKGIMEGLRHQGRPRRQWIHDIEEWTGCEYIQLKEMSQDRAHWRRKISEWSSAVANPHRGRSTSEWVSIDLPEAYVLDLFHFRTITLEPFDIIQIFYGNHIWSKK